MVKEFIQKHKLKEVKSAYLRQKLCHHEHQAARKEKTWAKRNGLESMLNRFLYKKEGEKITFYWRNRSIYSIKYQV